MFAASDKWTVNAHRIAVVRGLKDPLTFSFFFFFSRLFRNHFLIIQLWCTHRNDSGSHCAWVCDCRVSQPPSSNSRCFRWSRQIPGDWRFLQVLAGLLHATQQQQRHIDKKRRVLYRVSVSLFLPLLYLWTTQRKDTFTTVFIITFSGWCCVIGYDTNSTKRMDSLLRLTF